MTRFSGFESSGELNDTKYQVRGLCCISLKNATYSIVDIVLLKLILLLILHVVGSS
jgi:hypothetical protein